MGIGRGAHETNTKRYLPCELYPLSVHSITRRLLWARESDLEAPNQLTDWRASSGAQVASNNHMLAQIPAESALWWTVTAWAREVTREQTGPGTVNPLSGSIVESGLASTPIQLRLNMRGETVYVDIGPGVQFSVLAEDLNVQLWVPSRTVQSNVNRKRNVDQNGNLSVQSLDLENLGQDESVPVFDTDIDLNFTASAAPVGRAGPVYCTRTYNPSTQTDVPQPDGAAAPAIGDFAIPPRAKRVQFSVRSIDDAPTAGLGAIFRSDVVDRFDRGAVEQWSVGARERTSPFVDIPQNAGFVDLSELAGRIVTAVWELDL